MIDNPADLALVDFTPVQMTRALPQENTVDAFSWGIAKSYCVRHAITDDREANDVLARVRETARKYCVSTKYVKQRQGVLSITPEETFPETIRENGEYTRIVSHEKLFRELREMDTHPDGLTLKERMRLYDIIVTQCVEIMYQDETKVPDDLIHVTCSGYVAPSPVERLVSRNNWKTTVTNCYHKGCYAFFPGLRIAAGTHAVAARGWTAPKERVDVVHTEVLSLHMKLSSCSPEDLVAQSLFSDGFIRYSLVPEHAVDQKRSKGFRLLAFREHLVPHSLDAMTWGVGDHQFDMTLTVDVPIQVDHNIGDFVEGLFRQAGRDFRQERPGLYFAVHPGGPKIVDFICVKLGLAREQVEHSYKVLSENGNMSSATMPYLLNGILSDDRIPDGTLVPAVAFGPGLTISGAILQKIRLG